MTNVPKYKVLNIDYDKRKVHLKSSNGEEKTINSVVYRKSKKIRDLIRPVFVNIDGDIHTFESNEWKSDKKEINRIESIKKRIKNMFPEILVMDKPYTPMKRRYS